MLVAFELFILYIVASKLSLASYKNLNILIMATIHLVELTNPLTFVYGLDIAIGVIGVNGIASVGNNGRKLIGDSNVEPQAGALPKVSTETTMVHCLSIEQ